MRCDHPESEHPEVFRVGEQFRGMRAGGDGVALKIDAQLRISDRIF